MRKDLLLLDDMNLNHRVYLRDSFKGLPEIVPVLDRVGDFDKDKDHEIGFASSFQFDGNVLSCDVHLKKELMALLEQPSIGMSFVPFGFGNTIPVGSGKLVTDYSLERVDCVLTKDSVFPKLHAMDSGSSSQPTN